MQNICKLPRNHRNKLQVAHFLELAKNSMSKHNSAHNTTMASASTMANDDGLMLSGYQKKLKTMKKKYFVLYKDTQNNTARLEYYDNERKFKSGLPPKRCIRLRNCFSINRRLDTKHDFVIALSTKDGGFGIVLDTEDEMLRWLEVLISLQRANFNITEQLRPQYEHVWQVYIQRKGLAESKGIIGNYHVCLTSKSLTFVRIGADKTSDSTMRIDQVEFQLTTIRRCGDSQCYFYMEVGRQSVIGPGELWMETEDSLTAQNMHRMILSAMSAKVDLNNMGPMQRKRSSSANEASKPINVLQIKQTYADNKYNNSSPQTSSIMFGRERCDSLPTRNRTSSENSNHSFTLPSMLHSLISGVGGGGGIGGRNNSLTGNLRQHTYQRHSNSPPVSSSAIGCSESEESSISIDEPDDNGSFMPYRFNSRSSEGVIPEENTDEIGSSDTSAKYTDLLSLQVDVVTLAENYVNMAPVIAKSQAAMSSSLEENKLHMKQMQQQQQQQHAGHVVNSSPIHSSPRSTIEFAECAVDHETKILSPDDETPNLSRPTRAYSIGSRKQHMGGGVISSFGGGGGGGLGSATTNDADQNSCGRVRAFSVGSRAKIPRCDLQRCVLSPKMLYEQQQQQQHQQQIHCHSNNSSNNNINADAATQLSSSTLFSYNNNNNNNNLMQIYGHPSSHQHHHHHHRDKKSISAPLLIHKSQNSVDRMSDLMEIDFSLINKQSSSSTNSRINLTNTTATTTTILPTFTTTSSSSSLSSLLAKTTNINNNTTTTSTTTITSATVEEKEGMQIISSLSSITPTATTTTTIATSPPSMAFNNNNNNNNYHNNNYKQTSNSKSVLTTITTSTPTTSIATITTTITSNNNNNNNNHHSISNNNNRNNYSHKKYNTITATTNFMKQQQRHQQTPSSTTDNGYLEMKPVGGPSAPPTSQIPWNVIKKQQQQQQKKQRNGQLSKQQHTPKTITTTTTTTATATPKPASTQLSGEIAINESEIASYDVPPDRSNKLTNFNTNASLSISLAQQQQTTNTVLVNNQQKTQQQQQPLTITIENDMDNNPKLNNNDKEMALMINEFENVRIDMPQQQQQQQQQKQKNDEESKIIKKIVVVSNAVPATDEYMILNANTNSINNNNNISNNNNNNNKTPKKNITMPKLLQQHDNEKNLINNADEHQQHYIIQQQQKCSNRKSTGSNNSSINASNDETGYEMLQIKSDSSLQAHKTNKNNINNNKLPLNVATTLTTTSTTATMNTQQQRPRSTNCVGTSTTSTSESTLNDSNLLYSSSSTTSLNSINSQQQMSKPSTPIPMITPAILPTSTTNTTPPPPLSSLSSSAATATTPNIVNCNINKCSVGKITPTLTTSRPSSVNLEPHELYYASLDWPQCSSKDSNNSAIVSVPKATTATSTTIVEVVGVGVVENNVLPATTPSVHNVYAKIEFDHSDSSSSSSSKNI